jgi:ketosteroid isomerase-like protein
MSPEEADSVALLARLHAAQNAYYGGGPADELRELLTEDVLWSVPGVNAIAGSYEGRDAVMAYFDRRRAIASATLQLHPGEVLTGEGDHVAVLTDGTATVGGRQRRWSTVGLYRLRGGRVAACWLLPLDPAEFDAVWSAQAS